MKRNQNKKNQIKEIKCKICEKENKKYSCPIDQIPYCSVTCFNLHKQQSNCPGTKSKIQENINEIKEIETKPIEEPKEEIIEEERPIKRLKDLNWPEIDEEQSSVFYDPLRRDEIKPIRKFEWETIATSLELRSFLKSSDDSFKENLKRIHLESNLNLRNELIEELLGFEFHKDNKKNYHHRHNSVRFGLEDRKVFEPFSEIVKKILDQTRGT